MQAAHMMHMFESRHPVRAPHLHTISTEDTCMCDVIHVLGL